MELTLRAIDVGFGNTTFVSAVTNPASGSEIRCRSCHGCVVAADTKKSSA